MIIERVATPEKYADYGCDEDLDKWDLEAIPPEVEYVKYWYSRGSYDGSGMMILKTKDKYHIHDMSHCSCYGPTEKLCLGMGYETLEELQANCSDELQGLLPI